MTTNTAALNRLFVPDHSAVTLQRLERAALARGRKLKWNWRESRRHAPRHDLEMDVSVKAKVERQVGMRVEPRLTNRSAFFSICASL